MMKINILLLLLTLASCGKSYEAKVAKAARDGVKLDRPFLASTSLDDFGNTPDTFTFFWLPKLGSMNWSSSIFNVEDDDVTKISDILANVVKVSDAVDSIDTQTTKVVNRMNILEDDLMFDADCDMYDYGDDEQCDAYTDEYDDLETDLTLLTNQKTEQLRNIEMTVDNIQYVDDGTGTGTYTAVGSYENWFTYDSGASIPYEVDLSLASPKIKFPNMGIKFINGYSTDDGSIYDVKYIPSQYAPDTMMLHFKVAEKGAGGAKTSMIWEAELERIYFAGKLRFSGDIYRKDKNGKIIQRGIMKFELQSIL
jgi:hypothetical protein